MPDSDRVSIDSLTLAPDLSSNDVAPVVHTVNGVKSTYKTTMTLLGTFLNKVLQYSADLTTNSKTIIGAINEINAGGGGGGAVILYGTTAPASSLGSDGNLYVQYTAGTGGASDVVDALYVKLDGEWCEISTGGGSGSGGHVIVDEDGTSLAQRANLQFNGAYLEDNSGDDTTEVNVVREMTRAQFDQLTAAEKTGLINITDESLNATEIPISSNNNTNTKAYIDNGLSDKVDTTDFTADNLPITSGSATNTKDYIDTEKVANNASYLYTPTVTEPTLTNGSNYNNRTFYYKHGTRVWVYLGVSDLQTSSSYQALFSLPTGYKPRVDIVAKVSGYAFANTTTVRILTNGEVRTEHTQDQGCFGYIEFDAYS